MKYTFVGIDKDLEISLREYGLLVSVEPNEDGSGTHFIIYRNGCNDEMYGTGHISEETINGYMQGKEFMDANSIEDVLNFVGEELEDWFKHPFVTKLHDLISYWGSDNIMGTDYYPNTYEEVMKNWINKD